MVYIVGRDRQQTERQIYNAQWYKSDEEKIKQSTKENAYGNFKQSDIWMVQFFSFQIL